MKQTSIIFTEAYRSGHNGTDSKSVDPKGSVGSNPTASAKRIIGTAFYEQCRLLKICLGGIRVPDYKAMYYHLAGRMATAVDALEATTNALVDITEKLKLAQQATEEMFISAPGDDGDSPDNESVSE